jgi:GGDEF domain-containing protein
MVVPRKSSKASSIIAALCIVVYIGAIAFGAVQIIISLGERHNLAEREFYDLADRATSSSVFLGFMSEAYQATIRDFMGASDTLLGVIITGSSGEYAFEKYGGSGIVWTADSPRFKTGIGYPGESLFLPLPIEGQRNVTIQATYGRIDYGFCQGVLRQTLLFILSALIVAFITLLVERTIKNRADYYKAESGGMNAGGINAGGNYADASAEGESAAFMPAAVMPTTFDPLPLNPAAKNSAQGDEEEDPKGLYKPRGNIGWDSYTNDRLSAELHRCSSFEQDLVFLAMELTGQKKVSDSLYNQFTDEAVSFFTMRDMIFGKGDNGITVIMPNTDLDQGMAKCEHFHSRLISKLQDFVASQGGAPKVELSIGLSSRSGRLIEADRLILEAYSALEKAVEDTVTHIVAFKSDPEKYREFIKTNY